MKKLIAAAVVATVILAAPASAGSLSDPIVVPEIDVIEDAMASSGKPMSIVILSAIILLATVY